MADRVTRVNPRHESVGNKAPSMIWEPDLYPWEKLDGGIQKLYYPSEAGIVDKDSWKIPRGQQS